MVAQFYRDAGSHSTGMVALQSRSIHPQEYLDLAEALGLPPLKTNMTLTQFRASTKLDLSVNLKK